MPYRKRLHIAPTEDWSQPRLQFTWPEQVSYELIRPVVLFGSSPAERAKQTGVPERTLRRKADRFDAEGMASLFQTGSPPAPRALPPAVRRAIAELKAEYPAFRPHALARICYARFGRRPSPHTVKRVLTEEPPRPRSRDGTRPTLRSPMLLSGGWPPSASMRTAGPSEVSRAMGSRERSGCTAST